MGNFLPRSTVRLDDGHSLLLYYLQYFRRDRDFGRGSQDEKEGRPGADVQTGTYITSDGSFGEEETEGERNQCLNGYIGSRFDYLRLVD